MKRKTINIIITIIICVVITCTLSLPVFAEETVPEHDFFAFNTVNTTFIGKTINSALVTSPTSASYESSFLTSGSGYDQYIETDFVENNGAYSYMVNKLISNDFNKNDNKKNINYISLEAGIFCDESYSLGTLPFPPFSMVVNGKAVDDAFITSIWSTSTVSQQYPNDPDEPMSFTYSFKRLRIKILLDDEFRFKKDDTVVFVLRSQVFPIKDPYTNQYKPLRYSLGIDNLEVGYMSEADFIENASDDLREINDTLNVVSSSVDRTNQILDIIHNKLNQDLPANTQIKIENNYIIMEERYKEEESVEEEFDKVIEFIDDNGYEIMNNDNQGDIDSAKQSFNESGLGDFSNTIWNIPWIMSAVLLSLGFVGIKVGLFGV